MEQHPSQHPPPDDVAADDDASLFAALGVSAQAQEHLEQHLINQALATAAAAAAPPAADGAAAAAPPDAAHALAEQLLAVEQEAEAVTLALTAQQQDEQGWASSDDEEAAQAAAAERSNRQLEAAVMQQRLDALQEQQQQLQQQLTSLPQQQQHNAQQHLLLLRQQQQQQHGRRRGGGGAAGRGRGRGRGGRGGSSGHPAAAAAAGDQQAPGPSGPALVETQRDRLIRCGLLTPFDRLEGFERRVQGSSANAAAAPAPPAPVPGQQQQQLPPRPRARSAAAARPRLRDGAAPVDEQWALMQRRVVQAPSPAAGGGAAGGSVPPALADVAHQVGRSGLPLSELLAKAAQQSVEVGIDNRPRAVLMQPHEVPRQERDIIRVNPMLWRAGAGAAAVSPGSTKAAQRPRRASTLPRQKRKRHGVALLKHLSEAGPDGQPAAAAASAAGGGGSRKRRRCQQAQEGVASMSGSDHGSGSSSDGGWVDSEDGSGQELGAVSDKPGGDAAAAAAAGSPPQHHDGHGTARQQQHSVADGADSGPAGSERETPDSEEEYLPSDVEVTARQRRRGAGSSSRGGSSRGSRQPAAAAAAAAAAADDDQSLEDSGVEGLVPEAASSGRRQQRKRPRQPKAASAGRGRGGARRQRGSEASASQASGAAAAAAAGGLSSSGEDDAAEDSEEEALLLEQEERDLADELAEYDDLDDTVYELRMQRAEQQRREQEQHAAAAAAAAAADSGAGGGSTADGDGAGAPAASAAAAAGSDAPAAAAAAAAASGAPAAEAEAVPEDPAADAVFDGGFRVPAAVWAGLFGYQRTGVKWLWELHNQRAGGIIGDEMGLGKTIQVIAYLAGLHASGMWRPTLVVAPATVLRQWMTELRTWYPPLRVYLLHESGRSPPGSQRPNKAGLLDAALLNDGCSLVLTTYEQLRLQRELLLPVRWGVTVLDEGHKIRNPDAEVTLAAKQLQTVHRLIMSGSPIQNRLSELWSLFDFIFPGKLGTLPVFTAQFAIPITVGGYTNASKLQVQTAYRCAVVLRDLISPYLLRRRKADVATQLPKKTETVLFCSLTEAQRDLYRAYLNSAAVADILSGRRHALAGIDVLRKVCNHPDLLERATAQGSTTYGEPARSGKLQVLVKVLTAWHAERHKVLLFTQTQQMLDIIEKHVVAEGYCYHRMDGNTPIAARGRLMDDFNTNPDRFLFLLTTKVGGLGVNLTGANRVVIYDPDWNPSTDSQARERAWRIGQGRPVTIYRLITSGTIEEKVYHRQIYKSFLTNKVLQDPRQRRFFAARDITDLFTLADEHGGLSTRRAAAGSSSAAAAAAAAAAGPGAATETGRIFSDVVREQKGAAALPPPPTGSGSSRGRQARPGCSSSGTAGRRRGQPPQPQPAAGNSDSPPLSPTARAAAGLAVVAPALDSADNAAAAAAAAGGGGPAAGGADDDARVLRDLFEGAGIKSLMDHTSIEGAHDPEARQADAAAAKVAAHAAEMLRQSRLACQAAAVNEPTWTGRHGSAGLGAVPPGRAGAAGGGARRGAGSPSAAAPAAATAPPKGRFGRVTNPLLAVRPLYEPAAGVQQPAPSQAAAARSPAPNSPAAAAAAAATPPPNAAAAAGGGGSLGGRLGSPGRAFSGQLAGARGGAAAPSSAALLAQLRQRQAHAAAAAGEDASARGTRGGGGQRRGGDSSGGEHAAMALASRIVEFIQAAGGAAGSDDLVSHFGRVLQPSEMPLFKQLLRQVAQLQAAPGGGAAAGGGGRRGTGGGAKVWVLKAEWNADAAAAAPAAAVDGGC